MNLSDYREVKPHYFRRILWFIINHTIFRLLIGGTTFRKSRNFLLKIFGAELTDETLIYNTVDIFMPWNLRCGRSCISPHCEIYNKEFVSLGDDTVISKNSFVCTASHDISSLLLPTKNAPITICDKVWIASHVYIGPGVTIGEGAVVGATASVYKDVEPWTVVGGNPAKYIKQRELKDA